MRNFYFLFILLFFCYKTQAQSCHLEKWRDGVEQAYLFDADDIPCITEHSEKDNILIYTFGIWCTPCIEDFPDVLKLVVENELDFYVLIKDKEDNWATEDGVDYLMKVQEKWEEVYPDFKINTLILKDADGRPNKKYRKFLDEITPSKFENITDLSKLILYNNEGELQMITTWKDKKDENGEDIGKWKMIENKIIPLIK